MGTTANGWVFESDRLTKERASMIGMSSQLQRCGTMFRRTSRVSANHGDMHHPTLLSIVSWGAEDRPRRGALEQFKTGHFEKSEICREASQPVIAGSDARTWRINSRWHWFN